MLLTKFRFVASTQSYPQSSASSFTYLGLSSHLLAIYSRTVIRLDTEQPGAATYTGTLSRVMAFKDR